MPLTFTVNGTADLVDANPGDGICASAGPASICSLRAAIEEANASPGDDTIVVPAGTYVLDASHGSLVVADPLGMTTVSGAGASTTFIDGDDAVRVFEIGVAARATIEALTVTHGHADSIGHGGGILNGGTLTLTNAVVAASRAFRGGGIAHEAGLASLTLTNTTVDGNTALDQGGGIYILSNRRAVVTIAASTISNNTVTPPSNPQGGGIYNGAGSLTMVNSTVSGNTAATAIPVSAAGNGGGIFSLSSVFLNNVTITNNSADIAGGVAGITAEFGNTVIAGNHALRAPDCRFTEGARSLGHNVVGDGTECLLFGGLAPGDSIGTADTPVDPRLGPLAANGGATETHAPLANSLLLDGGTEVPPGPPRTATADRAWQLPVCRDGSARRPPSTGRRRNGTLTCDIGAVEATAIPTSALPQAGIRVEAFAETGSPPAEHFGPVVNTAGDLGSAVAVAEGPSVNFGHVRGYAEAILPPRISSDPGLVAGETGDVHVSSEATCCITIDGFSTDFRHATSSARIVRTFVATPASGTVNGTDVEVEAYLFLTGALHVETPNQGDCINCQDPPPLLARLQRASVKARITGHTMIGSVVVLDENAEIDLAIVRGGGSRTRAVGRARCGRSRAGSGPAMPMSRRRLAWRRFRTYSSARRVVRRGTGVRHGSACAVLRGRQERIRTYRHLRDESGGLPIRTSATWSLSKSTNTAVRSRW